MTGISEKAIACVVTGDVRTPHQPVIFTSCRKAEAEDFVAANPGHALIHSTPAGAALEELRLFDQMSMKTAYLHWFYLSARFVVENAFPDNVLFFANHENPTSTAFGIEIPLLYHLKPNIRSLTNPLAGRVIPREDWLAEGLMRPYVLGLTNLYMHGPDRKMDAGESLLHAKFGEAADGLPTAQDPIEYWAERGLKMMVAGYLHAHGNFPRDPKTPGNPLTCALVAA